MAYRDRIAVAALSHLCGRAGSPLRGMAVRLIANPENADEFFAVLTDGSVICGDRITGIVRTIAEELPPAYDFAAIP